MSAAIHVGTFQRAQETAQVAVSQRQLDLMTELLTEHRDNTAVINFSKTRCGKFLEPLYNFRISISLTLGFVV